MWERSCLIFKVPTLYFSLKFSVKFSDWKELNINLLKMKCRRLYLKTQFVTRSKHFITVIKTNQLTLHRAKVAVRSESHTKHINTLCGQNVLLLNVKPFGASSNQ
jgi:hypothetical protein